MISQVSPLIFVINLEFLRIYATFEKISSYLAAAILPYVFYENFGVPEAVRRRLRLIDLAMRFLIRTYGGRQPDEARRAKTWPNQLFSA